MQFHCRTQSVIEWKTQCLITGNALLPYKAQSLNSFTILELWWSNNWQIVPKCRIQV